MTYRAFVLALLVLCAGAWTIVGGSAPNWGWSYVDRTAPAWSFEEFQDVDAQLMKLRPTGLVIEQDGRTIAEWGEVGRKVDTFSLRKSMMSALYGIAIAEGRIDPGLTLAQLGIDDKAPSLTDEEKEATVRDLLGARSGVYHPSAGETADMKANRPARGSHPHGTFWSYNNFDFNALGTIYEKLTGWTVAQAFERRIARPTGMNFVAADATVLSDPVTEHPALRMMLSARDLARFGRLYLDRGRWAGRQIVPAEWIDESTRRISDASGGMGYGYMWWQPSPEAGLPRGTYLGLGKGGQVVAVVPEQRLVVAETVDLSEQRAGVDPAAFLKVLRSIVTAAETPA